MPTKNDDNVFDLYELVHTGQVLNPVRVERQRKLLTSARGLPALELLEDARFLMKIASVRLQDVEATPLPVEPERVRRRIQPETTPRRRRRGPVPQHKNGKVAPLPDVAALGDLQLARGWTIRQLAEAMKEARIDVKYNTLLALLSYKHKPREHTLGLIQKFLRSTPLHDLAAPPTEH
jgi:hypothetical protein